MGATQSWADQASPTTDIVKAVKGTGVQVDHVDLVGTFSMQDKYGKATEDQVVQLTFEAATLAKIDFANFDSANVYDIADSSDVWPQFS